MSESDSIVVPLCACSPETSGGGSLEEAEDDDGLDVPDDGRADGLNGRFERKALVGGHGKHLMVGVGEVGDSLQPLASVMNANADAGAGGEGEGGGQHSPGSFVRTSPSSFSKPGEASAALTVVSSLSSSSSSSVAAAAGSVLGRRVCDQVSHDVQLPGRLLRRPLSPAPRFAARTVPSTMTESPAWHEPTALGLQYTRQRRPPKLS